jgi:pimeloyl-ACP methyl ester carboxylesterase
MKNLASNIEFASVPFGGRSIQIEYQWLNPDRTGAPVVVFLHEGLGSVGMWRDYPQSLCDAGGFRGLVFSRYGYGRSTPRPPHEKWPVEFMNEQARDMLPVFLRETGVDGATGAGRDTSPAAGIAAGIRPRIETDKLWLFGHSDGGSIALIFAALYPNSLAGAVVLAPHLFVEDLSISSIELAKANYVNTDLSKKLARYHDDVDSAFWGWNDIWLNPEFRKWNITPLLGTIRCPVLAVQGFEDEYGTMAQIDTLKREVPHVELLKLSSCRHSPQRDQPEALTQAVVRFIREHSIRA